MGTRKKATQPAGSGEPGAAGRPQARPAPPKRQQSAAYERALRTFTTALEQFHRGAYGDALEALRSLDAISAEEPELAGRARVYAAVCERKLRGEIHEPRTAEDRFHLGVARANEGRLDEALRLIEQAIQEDPRHPGYLYARASVRALQGNAEAAAADLRKAIELEPRLRYQAANDPDFQLVRDNPRFVDVIEPTPGEV